MKKIKNKTFLIKKNTCKTKNGSILAYALIILVMMIMIVGSISFTAIIEKKSASSTDFSTQAFQTADNGVQHIIKDIYDASPGDTLNQAFGVGGAGISGCDDNGLDPAVVRELYGDGRKWEATFKDSKNNDVEQCTEDVENIMVIKSVGTYKDTARAVEVELDPCEGQTIITDLRDGQKYPLIAIGKQCWMKQNINIGTMVNGGINQGSNCSNINKYCMDNNPAHCSYDAVNNYDGGLYQWDQAMCGSLSCNGTGESSPACASPVKGICPSGFHIPSHYEWNVLERAVCTSGSCSIDFPFNTSPATENQRGTNEGVTLKNISSATFSALLTGLWQAVGSFDSHNTWTLLWTSTESSVATQAWVRALHSSDSGIWRNGANGKGNGFSVRCVKN